MLNRLTRAVKTAVRRRVHECGRTITHMLRPVRTGAALVCAVSIDAVRPRSALVAENALLRQQILVLRRAAPSRPRLHAEDRLILVLLARLNTAWRDAACRAITRCYRAVHRRAVTWVTGICVENKACGRCGKPRFVRVSNALVGAFFASTGRAASPRGFFAGAAGLTRWLARR